VNELVITTKEELWKDIQLQLVVAHWKLILMFMKRVAANIAGLGTLTLDASASWSSAVTTPRRPCESQGTGDRHAWPVVAGIEKEVNGF
jgi:hypothetical protein